jgi:hypothetical protein
MKICLPKNVRILAGIALSGLVTASMSAPVHAGTVTYITPSGSTSQGSPVDAEAVFTTGAGSLTITLTNLEVNPTSVGQNLSDVTFTLSDGTNASFQLASSSGTDVSIDGHGDATVGSTVSTGWDLSTSGTTSATLDVLGSARTGITANSTITSMSFSFGTTPGNDVAGVVSVPAPSSLVLGMVGLGVVGTIRFCRRRRQA